MIYSFNPNIPPTVSYGELECDVVTLRNSMLTALSQEVLRYRSGALFAPDPVYPDSEAGNQKTHWSLRKDKLLLAFSPRKRVLSAWLPPCLQAAPEISDSQSQQLPGRFQENVSQMSHTQHSQGSAHGPLPPL